MKKVSALAELDLHRVAYIKPTGNFVATFLLREVFTIFLYNHSSMMKPRIYFAVSI